MLNPEIREIQAALSLVRNGCFASAAAELGITQPAVSQRIAKLEQILGFPVFHRRNEGTKLTAEGAALLPLLEEVDAEFQNVLRRASYWKRAKGKQLNVLIDGSVLAQSIHFNACSDGFAGSSEKWSSPDDCGDWIGALRNYGTDLVLAGSFLGGADLTGIRTAPLLVERGVTAAWNPEYYHFDQKDFSFPEAVSTTLILPADRMAAGFRQFITGWCATTYGRQPGGVIEANTEADAIQVCRQGMGVLLLPGEAERRLTLEEKGLHTFHSFKSLLPEAFVFGVRYRADERNPQALEAVARLSGEESGHNKKPM